MIQTASFSHILQQSSEYLQKKSVAVWLKQNFQISPIETSLETQLYDNISLVDDFVWVFCSPQATQAEDFAIAHAQ